MKKEKIDFTKFLIEITKEEIKKGELRLPRVFFYKDDRIRALAYNYCGNHEEKLDILSVQIRTFIQTIKPCTIGVIFEGVVTDVNGVSDAMILTIEDGITCKNIIYTMDEKRNVIDVSENISSISDCPVVRFQNFYKTDYIFNKYNVEKILSKDITITKFKSDILNLVKEVSLAREKKIELSFVIFKKKKSNKLFSAMLSYETDIDEFLNDRENELVSCVRYDRSVDSVTNTKKELVYIYNLLQKTGNRRSDVYEIIEDKSLRLLRTIF